MRKYKLKELRELVRLGVAEDYTNKPSEYIYTLCRLEKVGYSSGVYGINGGLVQEQNTDTLTGTEHKATYKAITSSRIDTTALKRELPGVAAQYTRATETRRFTFS